MYQQQNNSAKVIATGRKAIELNPTNPVPLVAVASALVMDTRETDLDRDARYAEAGKDAQAALDNVDTGLQVPPERSARARSAAKANLRSIAYDTLGVIAMNKKDYAGAEQNFQKAADLMKDQPDAVVYLRLSVAQDNENKYPAGPRLRQQSRTVRSGGQRREEPGQTAAGPVAEADGGEEHAKSAAHQRRLRHRPSLHLTESAVAGRSLQ